ncbi:hypothetical protein OK18_19130 [Chryseobacterium gallinarum]|uniref:Uncharacterized protein n=1 Tax=Chryseobacterium gallinarum TaxID=1324352 RepID=A0A0G3M5J4_CHRGL|nr:phage capsid protein [Chryseobacterium gallinarum]AKK74446.1 hypothetical protein OK18_19130 [Chryseobacterium gallinarum]
MANPKVPQELWVSYIIEKLWKTNPHLKLCFDESKFVKGGSIVYVPQAGAKPNVVKNRPNIPAVAVQRGDTVVFYPLDVYSTDPTVITWTEGMEISYAKTDSVLGDHTNTLVETVGDDMLYNWVRGFKPIAGGGSVVEYLPASKQIKTTGPATAVNSVDGQTGQRKGLHHKEFQKAQAMMNKDNVPKEGRYAMTESNMYQEFIDSLSANQMAAFQATADLANGIVGKFAGFTFLERSSVLAFDPATNQPILPGEALAGDSNLGCLLWHKDSVSKATGDTELFQDMRNPLYYGDVHSGLIKTGGRCRREDWKGVMAIVQDAV